MAKHSFIAKISQSANLTKTRKFWIEILRLKDLCSDRSIRQSNRWHTNYLLTLSMVFSANLPIPNHPHDYYFNHHQNNVNFEFDEIDAHDVVKVVDSFSCRSYNAIHKNKTFHNTYFSWPHKLSYGLVIKTSIFWND